MSDGIGEVGQQQSGSNDAQEATAAAAAFANARGESPREPVVEDRQEVVEQQEPVAEEPAKVLAGMTEAQIAELLGEIPKYRKQIDNQAGHIGKLNAAIQSLRQETSRGDPVSVTDEDVADIGEHFPELAGMTKNALNKVLSKLNVRGTGTAQTPEEYVSLARQAAEDVASKERVKTHVELLNGLNPGWEKITGLPDQDGNVPETDYRKWLIKQPVEYQEKILNSNNAFEIGSSITAFKAATEAAAKKQQQNKQRLANAVQPEGGQSAARGVISEQSAADKAFQARRQRT